MKPPVSLLKISELLNNAKTLSPESSEFKSINSLLDLRFGGAIHPYLTPTLLEPAYDLVRRPGKKLRGRLVRLAFQLIHKRSLSQKDVSVCQELSKAIEFLHAGSLAIDDIQDGSKIRRGQPTLHLKYGMSIALNVGNWLYFWPLEIIHSLNLKPEIELKLCRFYTKTLIRAHVGQALDLGLRVNRIPQADIHNVCLSTMELKSGALFALALVSGAVAAGANDSIISALDEFGHGLGIGLQMYDDIGNIRGKKEPIKKWEDLMLRRPSWVWGCAARYYPPPAYDMFLNSVLQLPQDRKLNRWFEQTQFIHLAKSKTTCHMENCLANLEKKLKGVIHSTPTLHTLRKIIQEISQAYD